MNSSSRFYRAFEGLSSSFSTIGAQVLELRSVFASDDWNSLPIPHFTCVLMGAARAASRRWPADSAGAQLLVLYGDESIEVRIKFHPRTRS